MFMLGKNTFKRMLPLIVISIFFFQQISWALPELARDNSTLAVESLFQTAPMTDLGMEAQHGFFPKSTVIYTIRNIAGFLLEDEKLAGDKDAREMRLEFLEGVLRFDAIEIYKRLEAHAESINALDAATITNVIESAGVRKGDSRLDPYMDLSKVRFHPDNEKIISVLYRRPEKDFIINIALRGTVDAGSMPGKEIYLDIISEKYIVTIMAREKEDDLESFSPEDTKGDRAYTVDMPGVAEIPGYTPGEKIVMAASDNWVDSLDPEDEAGLEERAQKTARSAVQAAEKYRTETGLIPTVAFISYFTTKKDAKLSTVPYVKILERARQIVLERIEREELDINVVGEGTMQLDAAMYPGTYVKKTQPKDEQKGLLDAGWTPDGFPPKVMIFPHIHSLEAAKSLVEFLNEDGERVAETAVDDLVASLEERARSKNARIVIPETDEPEILKAVARYLKMKIGEVVLLGSNEDIARNAGAILKEENEKDPEKKHLDDEEIAVLENLVRFLEGEIDEMPMVKVIYPHEELPGLKEKDKPVSDKVMKYARQYCRVTGKKPEKDASSGVTWMRRFKRKYLNLEYASGMVSTSDADCMVAGKHFDSGSVITSIKAMVGTAKGVDTLSAGYLMQSPFKTVGTDGKVVLADITTNVCPNARQLAEIAVNTGRTVKDFVSDDVRIAFVSEEGATSPKFDKAFALAKEMAGDEYTIDGPMSMREALEGGYNAIILRDLSAANPLYKSFQRLGDFEGMCLISGGSAKPVNDLSRGSDYKEIYNSMLVAAGGVKRRKCSLTVNCGSSSVKYKLYDMEDESVVAEGNIENISEDGSKGPTHLQAIEALVEDLPVNKEEILSIGHRVVHGAEIFTESVLIDDEGKIEQAIEDNIPLAPLHNPANLIGIRVCKKLFPDAVQVAVPDTAVHQTMNPEDFLYAIPYFFYKKYKLRRYGFHGSSHRYVSERAADIAGKDKKDLNIITCHLGNGASIAAFEKGKVVDTSMGVTPLEGLVMGTRSGDIDPAIVDIIAQEEGISASQVIKILNKESGFKGVSGIGNDMRDLEGAEEENMRARLARKVFILRLVKYIGAYDARMGRSGGADIIVFTGGIGEKDKGVQREVSKYFRYRGLLLDEEKIESKEKEKVISRRGSSLQAMVIPTDEELVLMRDTKKIYNKVISGESERPELRSIMDVHDDELIGLAPYDLNKAHIYRLKNLIDIIWQPGMVEGDPEVIEGYRNLLHKLAIAQAVSSLYGSPDMATSDWQGDDPRDFLRAHGIFIPKEMEFFMENNMFVRNKEGMFERIKTAEEVPGPDVPGLEITDFEKRDWMRKILTYFTLADSIEMGADYLRGIELKSLKGEDAKIRPLETPAESLAFMLKDFPKRMGGVDARTILSPNVISAIESGDTPVSASLHDIYEQASSETFLTVRPENIANIPIDEEVRLFDLTSYGREPLNRAHSQRVIDLFDILWTRETVDGRAQDIDHYRNIFHKFMIAHAMGNTYGSAEMAELVAPVDMTYAALEAHNLSVPVEIDILLKGSVFRDKKAALKAISECDELDNSQKKWLKKMYVYFVLADTIEMGADYLRVKELPRLKGRTPREFDTPLRAIRFMKNDLREKTGERVEDYLSEEVMQIFSHPVSSDAYGRLQAIALNASEEVHLPEAVTVEEIEEQEFDILFEKLESTVNNRRAKLEKKANILIDYLRDWTGPDSAFRKMDLVDRAESTIEMKKKLQWLLKEIDILYENKELPSDIVFAEDDIDYIRENIEQFEADSVVVGVIALARKASRKAELSSAIDVNKRVVIALENGWIPGYGKSTLQHNALSPLVSGIASIGDVLRSMGMDNVEVIVKGDGEEIFDWANKVKEAGDSNGDLSNIILLGSKEATQYFESNMHSGVDKKKRAFLASINPSELEDYYQVHGESDNAVIDIEILEMLSLAIELANGIKAPDLLIENGSYNPNLLIENGSYNPIERKVTFLPLPPMNEMEYTEILMKYKRRKQALMAA